jgi:hypothetical protein
MPDRSRVMTQTKRDTLLLQAGGLGRGLTTPPHKKIFLKNLKKKQWRPRPTQGSRADDDDDRTSLSNGTVFHEKLTVIQPITKSHALMTSQGSSLCSQEPDDGSNHETL